jgi:hypothetical protein
MRDHSKLKAFTLADQLAVEIYRVSKRFPREEVFGLTSQIRKAAVSAASNIVEGCARHTESDYLHFLDTSGRLSISCPWPIGLAIWNRRSIIPSISYAWKHAKSSTA